ncbi:glycosyltransferase family 4 protein [Yersinia mollaretii]|uniref:glycosyltransferase family 4 protein n=1 Tax=Yersinia mollaretii TaxID=33060 RepID=UPI0021BDEDE7|nr:glycosyltransferase family 4 protein [Yersinia mollaretii]
MLIKIFIICDTVYPDDSGGRKLSLGRIFEAKKSGFKVSVIHYNYTNSDVGLAKKFFLEHNIDYSCYTPKHSHRINSLTRCANYIISSFRLVPEPYYYMVNDYGFKDFLLGNIEKNKNIILSVESILLSGVIPWINECVERIELVFHNVESDFYRQLSISSHSVIHKAFFYLESIKIAIIEKYLFGIKDNKISFVFLSEKDLEQYSGRYPVHCVNTLINNNNIFIKGQIKRNVNIIKPFFLFPGGLNFPPNRYGLNWLLASMSNKISHLEVDILVTGAFNDNIKSQFDHYSCVKLVGYVSDIKLRELQCSCIAVISPIITGGGVKIKNIEAIKLNIPLIATRFSCEGIDTQTGNIHVTDNEPNSFYAKMESVLKKTMSVE